MRLSEFTIGHWIVMIILAVIPAGAIGLLSYVVDGASLMAGIWTGVIMAIFFLLFQVGIFTSGGYS